MKVAQPANDLTGSDRLLGGFVKGFPDHRQRLGIGVVVEQVAGAFTICGYRGQRLVELMRK